MREILTMWRHTKMVVLVALTAGVYAAILIPLKGIPLIPGFTEIRPANVVPVVFSLVDGVKMRLERVLDRKFRHAHDTGEAPAE